LEEFCADVYEHQEQAESITLDEIGCNHNSSITKSDHCTSIIL